MLLIIILFIHYFALQCEIYTLITHCTMYIIQCTMYTVHARIVFLYVYITSFTECERG